MNYYWIDSDVIGCELNPKGISCSFKWCRKYKQSQDQEHLLGKQLMITFYMHMNCNSNK